MAQSQFFEIRRRSPHRNLSLIIATDQVRGTAICRDPVTPPNGIQCDTPGQSASKPSLAGFLTRDVVTGGPTVIQRAQLFGDTPLIKELELPFVTGAECSLEHADAYVVEGDQRIVLSGTGAITNATAIGTRLSFKGGKTYVGQTGDDMPYYLSDNSGIANTMLTADGDGPRIRVERLIV